MQSQNRPNRGRKTNEMSVNEPQDENASNVANNASVSDGSVCIIYLHYLTFF